MSQNYYFSAEIQFFCLMGCLEFLSTLKDLKREINAKDEKELFYAGSKRSMYIVNRSNEIRFM